MDRKVISMKMVEEKLLDMVHLFKEIFPDLDYIIGVSRGGIIPATLLWKMQKYQAIKLLIVNPFDKSAFDGLEGKRILVVDDILDTGATVEFFKNLAVEKKLRKVNFTFLYTKDSSDKRWYVFPWEGSLDSFFSGAREQAVTALLRSIGEDPLREGLKGTPSRISRAYDELFSGYNQDPKEIISTNFNSECYDEMIILKDIEFYSMCEHHMLPFYGKVHFAYIPKSRIVGISKISRLVEVFSRRLQIQERMTRQIGEEFDDIMQTNGVAVVVEGIHLCMLMRGIKKENAKMTTSYMHGVFREKIATRNEFLRLIGK